MVESAITWDADMLMGKANEATENGSPNTKKRPSFRRNKTEVGKVDPAHWGLPGHLTEQEVEVYMKFRDELETRGGDFHSTVYCFGEEEGEAHCLTRWLRARKFVYDDVIKMVEEATVCRAAAREKGFYPDPVEALGCEASLYYALYPQLYTGFAKNGAPLYFSKPGVLHVDGMECITTLDGIVNFHWHVMMHDFANRLRKQKAENPDFNRFECFCVLDLANLTTSQLGSRSLAIVKEQAFIDSLCFPETMSKMIIVNAPRFFAASWRLIRGWLDARTASKIEVLSSRSSWEKRLNELIDADQLPVDYGGKGPDTNDILASSNTGGMKRVHLETLYLRGHDSYITDIHEGEEVQVSVFTRSTAGATFSITDAEKKHVTTWVDAVDVKHSGTSDVKEQPTSVVITSTPIKGPEKIKVKAESHAGRFSTHNYLLAFRVYPAK